MKIKVWAFVLIIVGTVAISCAGTFAAVKGFSLVTSCISEMRQARSATAQNPGNWSASQDDRSSGSQSGALPMGFNAGVSIPGAYGEMTARTEEEVLAAAEEAGTSTWGLAYKEGRLDELKQKVLSAVEASLKQMVSKGTITQAQSDDYLNYVTAYLEAVGQTGGMTPGKGYGQGNGNWYDDRRQGAPEATADPGSKS